jgi:hypothetical protein
MMLFICLKIHQRRTRLFHLKGISTPHQQKDTTTMSYSTCMGFAKHVVTQCTFQIYTTAIYYKT